MTPTTEALRAQAFLPLECDIPRDLTIAQYRAQREPAPRRRRLPARLRPRRSSR